MEDNITEQSKRKALKVLTPGTIIFGILLIPGIAVTMMSVMLFDAPGSEENPWVLAFFYSIASFPVITVFSFSSWIFYFLKKYTIAVIISLLPLISILLVVFQFALSILIFDGSFGPK
jgi:hypothetical protein